MITFKDFKLNRMLFDALDEQNITTPTEIQQKALPAVMSGRDVVGIAQTGTGKTLAYLLPILKEFKYSNDRHPKVLIVVPTRELVQQIERTIASLTERLTINVVGVYGGANINTQRELIDEGVNILVATPGRLYDLTLAGVIRLKMVKQFVLDEVDEIFDLGFRPQLANIIELLPAKRQSIMFSATLTDDVKMFIGNSFYNPKYVVQAESGTPLENIKQSLYNTPNFDTKRRALVHLLQNDTEIKKALIFTKTKKLADQLHIDLEPIFEDEIAVLHSNKSQNYRFRSIDNFQDGKCRILISTDLISRGVDFKDVTHVINFDIPDEAETYIHRIGRTGRAERSGNALSFVNELDSEHIVPIEKLMGVEIEVLPIPEEVEITTELSKYDKKIDHDVIKYITKPKKRENVGPAFHERSAKNQKVPSGGVKQKMAKKYKKPIKKRR